MTLALLITAATGAWAQTETLLTTLTFGGTSTYSETTSGVVSVTATGVSDYNATYGWLWFGEGSLSVTAEEGYTITKCVFIQNAKQPITDTEAPFVIHSNAKGYFTENTEMDGVTSIEVYGYAPTEPDVEVTTNAASEGATFTEASFEMPTNDVDVDYELVRDMTQSMTVTVKDAQGNSRFRVQKAGENTYAPVGMDMAAVTALFNVHDDIENADLTLTQDYIGRIFPVNAQGQPQGDGILLANFNFAPGKYIVKAYAVDGSTYDGTTQQSNIFQLFQGYEVEIAAQSFATYYKDEALTIDESTAEDAALYTISEVTATEAVLSDEIEAAPKSTPLLVFNNSDKARTILLIPTNEPNLALTVAPEFKGTLTAKSFSEADMEAANFYVLTDANVFVWVKGAGQIAANKCWLQIEKTAPNNTRAIVFDNDATAISEIPGESGLSGDWYDISGRKVSNSQQPKTKGLYINGGRKVVIK